MTRTVKGAPGPGDEFNDPRHGGYIDRGSYWKRVVARHKRRQGRKEIERQREEA